MADLYKNPMKPVDNWGAVMKPYDTDADLIRLGERAAHIVTIDSRNRNRARYPNANDFRVQFQTPYRGVYSVELLNAIIPVPQNGMGTSLVSERYVTIHAGEFQERLDVIEPAQPVNPGQYDVAAFPGLGNDPWYSSAGDNGFAQIPLIPNFPLAYTGANASAADTTQATYWKKSECRVIKRFFPLKAEMRYIDIRLVLRNNINGTLLYPFADESADPEMATDPENNIVLQMEIVAKT